MKKLLFAVLAVIMTSGFLVALSGSNAIFSDQENTPANQLVAGTRGRPKVRVIRPNGGEALLVGTIAKLCWSADDPDGLRLEYEVQLSTNNGMTWKTIARDLDRNCYNWLVDAPPGFHNLVKVIAQSPNDPWRVTGKDQSDGPFIIWDYPER